jgi:hypothetical protein
MIEVDLHLKFIYSEKATIFFQKITHFRFDDGLMDSHGLYSINVYLFEICGKNREKGHKNLSIDGKILII